MADHLRRRGVLATALLVAVFCASQTGAWLLGVAQVRPSLHWFGGTSIADRRKVSTELCGQPAGSFFNPVPDDDESSDNGKQDETTRSSASSPVEPPPTPLDQNELFAPPTDSFEENVMKMLRERKAPSLASQPSTINGKPTAGQGFGVVEAKGTKNVETPSSTTKPYVGIGPRSLNDPTKPEYDDQGYTLYANETTGEKSRVFEALVDYPCDFTLKIVGANEGNFVQEMVAVVAESCDVPAETVPHSVRGLGKWMSVTVQAPVQSAEMLYQLYENVDRDPRVRFKF